MNRYKFTATTMSKLEEFKTYLKEENYAQSTVNQKYNYAGRFLEFLEQNNLQPEEVQYPEIIAFIEILKEENKSNRLVNSTISAVRTYYRFLQLTDLTINNPALNINLKGKLSKLPSDILSPEKLEEIYQTYPNKTLRQKQNKIILGLFIYQAITTAELHQLKTFSVRFEIKKLAVKGNKKTNSRILELHDNQIIELAKFIQTTREKIIKHTKTKSNQLFISQAGKENLKPTLLHLFREIRKTHPEVKNAKQLRTSRIVNKLKTENLRIVQFFAGHKHISSTEYYKLNYLDELKKDIDKYHPI